MMNTMMKIRFNSLLLLLYEDRVLFSCDFFLVLPQSLTVVSVYSELILKSSHNNTHTQKQIIINKMETMEATTNFPTTYYL
jgi:hypothetical protein